MSAEPLDIKRETVVDGIYQIIDDINETFSKKEDIQPTEDLMLIGKESPLDSLALVHLIAGLEDWIEDTYEITTVVAGEEAITQEEGPFRTISSLADHVLNLLVDKSKQ